MEDERLSKIIGIRVYPSFKKELQEEATARGQSLSDFIFDLIQAGIEKMAEEGVEQEGREKRLTTT